MSATWPFDISSSHLAARLERDRPCAWLASQRCWYTAQGIVMVTRMGLRVAKGGNRKAGAWCRDWNELMKKS